MTFRKIGADKKANVVKEASKSFVKGLTFNSIFDNDLTEEKANHTKEFSDKEILNHLLGRGKLSKIEVEDLKRAAKYRSFL
ncbi:hypothetical protein JOD45_000709 [Scopulibacillus daqui]|uniref:Uncharacterized protein n=1 Tax=Scopulibacillus daqui TaxID=1469162 RepID=A0ABS2PX45_9BACL|nr:hypothetical protein [Scopulibacillus daqui]MBM7644516.1 hypothetical protein [Scopulibacillus daqui]